MVETVGRRLQKARQSKRLSVDEVAAATKIRPERIVDLERDDLSHFPSLVYARSFLVKYARYLGVDIQDDLEQIQVGSTVGLGEYHYLQAAPPPKYLPEPRRREPSRLRLPVAFLAILALLVLIGVPVIAFLAINISRLNEGAPSVDQIAVESPSPDAGTMLAKIAAGEKETKEPTSSVSPTPTPTITVSVVETTPSPPTADEPKVEVRRALPVTPVEDLAQASPSPSSSATALETLEIRVRERTWLRVTKDKQNGEPIYNDFISPRSPPIVVQGKRFWLKLPDKKALELRKNGQAVDGPDNTIVIE